MTRPAVSFVAIATVLVAELLAAAAIAFLVGQAYIAYECSDPAYRSEHGSTCAEGFPYPLL